MDDPHGQKCVGHGPHGSGASAHTNLYTIQTFIPAMNITKSNIATYHLSPILAWLLTTLIILFDLL